MGKLNILVSAFACHPPTSPEDSSDEKLLGSGESILGWNLVKQISRFNRTWVITSARNRRAIEKAVQQGEVPSVRFHFIDFPGWLRAKPLWHTLFTLHLYYYAWQVLAFFAARKLSRDVHFDLTHHITFANDWMPSFIGAFLPKPFIWGPMGGGQKNPEGFTKEYDLKAKLSEFGRLASQWMGRNMLLSRRRCLQRARAILVCNSETKEKIPRHMWGKVHFFPVTGISDEDIFFSQPTKRNNGLFRIITTGRFVRFKRFDFAVRAYKVFLDNPRHAGSVLEIIGNGPQGGELKRLVRDFHLEDRVVFREWLPRNELLASIASSDVFLYTSLREGGGAVVVEAMACGTPVICLDAAGPGLHIQEDCGIKVKPENPEYVVQNLARALEKLYQDEQLRLRLGKGARRRAKEYYHWDRLGERLQEIYESSIG